VAGLVEYSSAAVNGGGSACSARHRLSTASLIANGRRYHSIGRSYALKFFRGQGSCPSALCCVMFLGKAPVLMTGSEQQTFLQHVGSAETTLAQRSSFDRTLNSELAGFRVALQGY
jgi:hypothetical protein